MSFFPTYFTVKVFGAPLPMLYLDALQDIEIETSTDQAGVLRLNFQLSQTPLGDWDVLQFDIFRPLVPVSVSVSVLPGLGETIINGYVRDARLDNRSEPGQSTLQVVGMDVTATLMNHLETSCPWPNMADSVIAQVIFGRNGVIPLAIPTPPTRTLLTTVTRQRGTDIRFLKGLAQRNSYECYVQPNPLTGLDTGYFGPPQVFVPPQGVLSANFGLETNLDNFQVHYAMLQPTSALATVLDPGLKVPTPGIGLVSLDPPLGREPALQRILPPPVVRPAGMDAANPAEVMLTTQSIATRSSRCIRGSGEVDGLKYGRVLRPGLPVAVRGAGQEYSGHYYVTRVHHSIATDHYTQRFEAWRNALGLTGAELFLDPMAALA